MKLKSLRINNVDVTGYGIHEPGQTKPYPDTVAKSLLNENNGRNPGCEVWEEVKPAKKAEKINTEVSSDG